MNLYDTSSLAALEAHTDPETGEIDFDAFETWNIALEQKRCAVIAYIKNSEAKAAMLTAEAKALAERAKVESTKAERLRVYLGGHLKACGVTEFRFGVFEAKVYPERDSSVFIAEGAKVPDEYLRPPKAPEPDKTALKKAMELGVLIDGVSIVKKDRMVIK
jgi:hypothetical protein